MLTQNQYLALQQNIRNLKVKLELLNEFDQIVDNLEGIAISGNINLDSSSTYRRTGNITMILDPRYNLLPNESSKLWFNKRVGVYIGLEYIDVEWFNLGKFAIGNIQIDKSVGNQTINCELLDYMAFLDGTLGGTLPIAVLIPAGITTISDAIKEAVKDLPRVAIDIVSIDGFPADVPMDIEKPAGSTVYELVKDLIDLYKNYEFYFDVNGFFRVQEIRQKQSDPIVWDFTATPLSLTHNATTEMKNIKNSIWVWGDTDDLGVQVSWRFRNRWNTDTIAERDTLIDKNTGDICFVNETALAYYWDEDILDWITVDFTITPSLNINNIGEKVEVLDDTNIITLDQAKLRAKFLLMDKSNFAQQLNFTTIPIYGLKPNSKIYLSIPDIGVEGEYLVTQISLPLGKESSNITCKKIYY